MNRNYAVNNLNQYTSAGPASFSYDNNGNLTGDGSHSFVYDALNRLTSRSGGGTAALVYDPLGRLLQTSGGSAGTTKFLYDGDELVAEYASNGSTILRRYVHGAGVDDPLVWYEGAGLTDKRYLIVNERGSIINVANASGGTIQINSYNDWGIPSATNLGRFQYTGQIWLPELGVYYYKARLYSPTLGRFMQTDPIGYEDGMNTYAYAGNDPMNGSDPTGLAVSSVPSCATRIGCTSVVLDTSGTNGAAQGTQNAAAQNSNGNAFDGEGQGTGRSITEEVPGGEISESQRCLRGCHDVVTTEGDRYTTTKENDTLVGIAVDLGLIAITRRPSATSWKGGRILPSERAAIQQARKTPGNGSVVPLRGGFKDKRFPDGTVKMRQNINGIEVHYIRTPRGSYGDFKPVRRP